MANESDRSLRATAARWAKVIGAALALYWVVLFISTHIPLPKDLLPRQSDKLMHFTAFAGLTFLLVVWLMARKYKFTLARYACVLFVIASYAAVDELLQIPVGRTADVRDYVADLSGAGAGLMAAVILRAIVRKLSSPARIESHERVAATTEG